MSTGGSIDERIRAVLDLGDSSGAVKALDIEVEKLLNDFKKQTELFDKGQMSSKDYTAALNKMKSEVSELSGAIKDLGGGGGAGGGDAFETVNRKLFALERGMSNLVGGTGLGRAGGLLESGIALFGGPAGLGFAIAMFANTLDNVLPKLESFWAHLWNKLTAEEVQEQLKALAEQGKKAKESLDAVFARPAPGQEPMEAHRAQELQSVFNIGTQRAGLQEGVQAVMQQRAIMGQGVELEEVQRLRERQRAIRSSTQFPNDPMIQTQIFELENQIRGIISTNVMRRANELMLNAQNQGPEGRAARKQLMDMIRDHPELFKGASGLIQHLRAADEEPYRPPTPEALEQDQQARLERAQRQFGRASRASQQRALQFTLESGGLEFVGPPAPNLRDLARARRRGENRRRLRRQRGELPEGQAGPPRPPLNMRKYDVQVGTRPEVERLRRTGMGPAPSIFPLQSPRIPRVGPPNPGGPQFEAALQQLHEQQQHREQRQQEERNSLLSGRHTHEQAARLLANPAQKAQYAYADALKDFEQMKRLQASALDAEHKGLVTHEKTQRTVAMLQQQIQRLTNRLQALDQNADNLYRNQQRSQQNTTGPH